MFRERAVHKGVIRIEQREHAAIILKQVDEEAGDFFLHGLAHVHEGGEVALTLFIERGDFADVQVLTAKLGGEAANAFVLHHAFHLSGEHIGLVEFAGGGKLREFGIGRG